MAEKHPKNRLFLVSSDSLTSTVNSRTLKKVRIEVTQFASKQILKLPLNLRKQIHWWYGLVQEQGLEGSRRISGYHDEPLRGKRLGQRSIRLNRSWRLFYTITDLGKVIVVLVLEVNKHEY